MGENDGLGEVNCLGWNGGIRVDREGEIARWQAA